jgi:site-specific DNA-methyltransferase (adenine-specific)
MQTKIINADSMEHLKTLDDNIFDSCVTDPPYHLASIVKRFGPGQKGINNQDTKEGRNGPYHRAAKGFMGQTWDGGDIAFQKGFWDEVYRVMKPGAYLLAFAATRNYHRLGVAIEDAGFEIRDMINWIYGSGFPKSHNIGKQMDKKQGNKRKVIGTSNQQDIRSGNYVQGPQDRIDVPITKGDSEWEGWGTSLKPAHEPIVMARKPIDGSVVDNILEHRTGAINIDGCRIQSGDNPKRWREPRGGYWATDKNVKAELIEQTKGRYPANIIHDGSDEVINEFKKFGESKGAKAPVKKEEGDFFFYDHKYNKRGDDGESFKGDTGTAARFFYSAKANKKEKGDTKHPTVKPLSLMRYLIKLVTPKEGLVLDPFAGTGTTGEACILEDRVGYLIEKEKSYIIDIENRIGKYNELLG